jgi:hypothetical protein
MEEISLRSACSASAELEKFQMLTSDNIKERKQQRGRRVLMQLAGTHFTCFTGTKSKPSKKKKPETPRRVRMQRRGTQFTCFTGTKVRMLTGLAVLGALTGLAVLGLGFRV